MLNVVEFKQRTERKLEALVRGVLIITGTIEKCKLIYTSVINLANLYSKISPSLTITQLSKRNLWEFLFYESLTVNNESINIISRAAIFLKKESGTSV